MLAYIKREPAVVSALVGAVLSLAVAFGLQLTSEQTGAILAVVTVLTGLVTRTYVTPTGQVAAHVDGVGRVVSGPADPTVPDGETVAVVPAPETFEHGL